jgi:signal transduction histidine kinase
MMGIEIIEVTKKVIMVLVPIVIMFVSMILTICVFGAKRAKRYPLFAVLSMLLNYVTFIFLKDIMGIKSAIVVWQSMNCIPIIVLIFSIVKKGKGNIVIDVISIVLSIGLFVLPFIYNWDKAVDYSLKMEKIPMSDTWLLSISCYVFALVSLLALYVLGKMMKDKEDDTNRYASIKEEIRKLQDRQTFKEAYSNASDYDMYRLVETLSSEIVSRIQQGNNIMVHRDYVSNGSIIESREILSDIKHSMATPLSQILTNCELIKGSQDNNEKEYVERIENITKLCLVIISSYVEQARISKGYNDMDIRQGLKTMDLYKNEYHKENVEIKYEGLPNKIEGYTNNQILTLLQPLVQNAIYASPVNGVVKLSFEQSNDRYTIKIVNQVAGEMPTLKDMNTMGYSSKAGHSGIGIQTVRNQLRMLGEDELTFELDMNTVTAVINLKKR